jgi:SnoaL-like domain
MSDEREIQEVLARYVRAADYRDGAAMSNIFLPEGNGRSMLLGGDGPLDQSLVSGIASPCN